MVWNFNIDNNCIWSAQESRCLSWGEMANKGEEGVCGGLEGNGKGGGGGVGEGSKGGSAI